MSDALSRTRRALDLIPFILEHQGIALDELAKKFGVSTETLYEDLNLIFCCGLPGYTPLELIEMNFDEGFVSVSNPQALDKPRKLSKQELLRLHLGLELCRNYAPSGLVVKIDALQSKIDNLLQQSSPVEVISNHEEAKLKIAIEAISKSRGLTFTYSSARSDSISRRTIFPTGISESLQHIYIEGLEKDGSINKNFRLDRMGEIELSDLSLEVKSPKVSRNLRQFRLAITSLGKNFIAENSAIILESHELPSGFEITIREVSENWLISEVFAYGGEVRVIEPKSIMDQVALIATKRLSIR